METALSLVWCLREGRNDLGSMSSVFSSLSGNPTGAS
jgi:hypothetical protein